MECVDQSAELVEEIVVLVIRDRGGLEHGIWPEPTERMLERVERVEQREDGRLRTLVAGHDLLVIGGRHRTLG